jgi:hypothetical protein
LNSGGGSGSVVASTRAAAPGLRGGRWALIGGVPPGASAGTSSAGRFARSRVPARNRIAAPAAPKTF